MPTLTHYLPGLQAMLIEMAQSHCRTTDQEAAVAVRRYLAEGQDTENLPEELVKQARGRKGTLQISLDQELIDKLTATAARHVRSVENEAAWALLWYIHTIRPSKAGPGTAPGQNGSTAQERAADGTA
jgi:hypothetical protein